MRPTALFSLFLLSAGWPGGGIGGRGAPALRAAEVMPVPVELQVVMILKILTYDRNLDRRIPSTVKVGVVFAPGDAGSVEAKDEVLQAFERMSDRTVQSRRIERLALEFRSAAQLEAAVAAEGVNVFYVAPGNAANLDAVLRVSRERQIITTTGVPSYVERGVAVGIGTNQDRPQILINLPSSRSAGTEFDASLLRLVRLYR